MSATNTITNLNEKKVYDYTKTPLTDMSKWSIKFGKHKGTTFGVLLKEHPDYCQWIVNNFDEGDALVQFINRSVSISIAEMTEGC
tara:strand:+ start:162 stop:416 length:255 start_codon:yes stop_codon:yes gene_type:complete